jgi:hypothetical protein
MPLAFKCGGSVRLPVVRARETHDAADVGTAVHAALRSLVETGSVNWDALPGIAASYGANYDEVRMLVAIGAKLWPQIEASFPDALTEVPLWVALEKDLTGHADILSIVEDVGRIGDWKSGRKDANYQHQMRAYGALLLESYASLRECTVTLIWLRDQEIENYTVTRADAESWWLEYDTRVVNWDGIFRVGAHCQHCPRSHECEAANAMVRRDVAAFTDSPIVTRVESELAVMAPEQIIDLYEKAALVESYAERVRRAIKHYVQAGHQVEAADGSKLELKTENRRSLEPLKAWPVLEDTAAFTSQDFAACIDMRISRVEKVLASKSPRGQGAAAVRKLSAALEAAGAIETTEVQTLAVKRAR